MKMSVGAMAIIAIRDFSTFISPANSPEPNTIAALPTSPNMTKIDIETPNMRFISFLRPAAAEREIIIAAAVGSPAVDSI